MRPGGVRKRTGKGSGYDPLDDLPMLAGLQTGRGSIVLSSLPFVRLSVCPPVRPSVCYSEHVDTNTRARYFEKE